MARRWVQAPPGSHWREFGVDDQRGRMNLVDYLLEWYRRGYWQNRYERQARRFVTLRLAAFRDALARSTAAA